jgi:hypothetical protein
MTDEVSAQTSFTLAQHSIQELDVMMFKHINFKWLAVEAELFQSKWFDYRFLHPVLATEQYAQAFSEVYRDNYRRNIDKATSEHISPLSNPNIFECKPATLIGLWRGRQVADMLCIPYETFLRLSYQERLRYWRSKHLPRPSQLYSTEVVERVITQWEKMQEVRLYFSELPEYSNQHYIGTPAQKDHHEFLMAQCDRKTVKREWLDILTGVKNLLPLEKVEYRFGIA